MNCEHHDYTMVEEYIRGLQWSPAATDHEKSLVAGNIRGFYSHARELIAFTDPNAGYKTAYWEIVDALGIGAMATSPAQGHVSVVMPKLRELLATPTPATGSGGESDNHKLDTDTHVFFYEQDFYVLSNFSAFTLQWKGTRFDTSEAAYHYEKFTHDDRLWEIRNDILLAPSAHEAFKLADRYKAHRRPDWDDVKVGIMREILTAKAEQHEYVRRKLLATGTRTLVEDSWRDDYWGWGPNRDGQNMLGKLWMEVRESIAHPAPAGGGAGGGS